MIEITDPLLTKEVILELRKIAQDEYGADCTGKFFLVGGAVRDHMLEKPVKDYDFSTPLLPDEVEDLMDRRGLSTYPIGKRFGTIGVLLAGQMVEITTFRQEKYGASRKPDVEFVGSVESDLQRRDFTINAMAIDICSGEVLDPSGGGVHLTGKLIKAVGKAEERFREDPLRMLRAYRFALQFGFEIASCTRSAIAETSQKIMGVSHERWAMEMDKILVHITEDSAELFKDFFDWGPGRYILPEFIPLTYCEQPGPYHNGETVFDHTVRVLSLCPPNPEIRWGALLHDIAKPATYSENVGISHFYGHEHVGAMMTEGIMDRFRFSNERKEAVMTMVWEHMTLPQIAYSGGSKKALRRFVLRTTPYHEKVFYLSRADKLGHSTVDRQAIIKMELLWANLPDILNEDKEVYTLPIGLGREIMLAFNLEPSPEVGEMVELVKEGVVNEELSTTPSPDECIDYLKKKFDEE